MSAALRALFVNEGALGTGVLGSATVTGALRVGLEGRGDVDARFVGLAQLDGFALRAAEDLTRLARLDLDAQTVRWHAIQAFRTRRLVDAELAREPADVMHVNSHSIAIGLGEPMRRVPTLLSVDVSAWDWRAMGIWRRVRPYSRLMVAPSLALERRALRRAALVLAWTGWARAGVLRACPEARCVLHHPGLDLQRFHPAPRAPRSRSRVLFVGGRFEAKGGWDLLAALEPVLGRDVELDVVTPEAIGDHEGVRVHRLSTGDAALIELYQQADVLCLPTHGDSMGWTLLEAMACATPVVCTPLGGIPEVVDFGRAGVLVTPGDRAGLREAVLGLLDDPDRRAALGAAGRARCEERYDARRQTDELVDLARAAVARASTPRGPTGVKDGAPGGSSRRDIGPMKGGR